MLEIALWKLGFCGEDIEKLAAKDLHELMRAWESVHRYYVGEACARTRLDWERFSSAFPIISADSKVNVNPTRRIRGWPQPAGTHL
jgi:hypothetical protein